MGALFAFLASDAGQTLLITAGGLIYGLLRRKDKKHHETDVLLLICERAYVFVEQLERDGKIKGSAAKLSKYLAVLGGFLHAATGKPLTDEQKRRAVEYVTGRAAAEKR